MASRRRQGRATAAPFLAQVLNARRGGFSLLQLRVKSRFMTISPAQCRAARGLLGIDHADLARRAVVTPNVIVDFENGTQMPFAITLVAIRAALEFAGVIFLDENGDGEGVRKRKRRRMSP